MFYFSDWDIEIKSHVWRRITAIAVIDLCSAAVGGAKADPAEERQLLLNPTGARRDPALMTQYQLGSDKLV